MVCRTISVVYHLCRVRHTSDLVPVYDMKVPVANVRFGSYGTYRTYSLGTENQTYITPSTEVYIPVYDIS
jgi:hypothetical protein